jgi:hypothetical protein
VINLFKQFIRQLTVLNQLFAIKFPASVVYPEGEVKNYTKKRNKNGKE